MPELSPRSAANPDFARVVELRQLQGLETFEFDIAPEPREAEALARLLDARSVRKMRFRGRMTRALGGGWQLAGVLGATAVQSCVVTLEPVTTRIDQEVRRTFLPATGAAGAAEVLVDPEEDDEIEPLGDRIDLGLVATEALALALPAYPRKPGATLAEGAGEPEDALPEEGGQKPFAALAALRGKLGDDS